MINYIRYSLRIGIVIESSVNEYADINYEYIGWIENTSYNWDAGYAKVASSLIPRNATKTKTKYSNGQLELKSGDIISVHLDFDNLSLSYIVNDEDYGVAHNIRPEKYRCAIHAYDAATVLKLL